MLTCQASTSDRDFSSATDQFIEQVSQNAKKATRYSSSFATTTMLVRSPLAENSTPLRLYHSVPRSDETWLPEWSGNPKDNFRVGGAMRGV
jgi:hypothetical protein